MDTRRSQHCFSHGSGCFARERELLFSEPALCTYCWTSATVADHIVPLSKKGPNCRENLQLLCTSCNAKKSDQFNNAHRHQCQSATHYHVREYLEMDNPEGASIRKATYGSIDAARRVAGLINRFGRYAEVQECQCCGFCYQTILHEEAEQVEVDVKRKFKEQTGLDIDLLKAGIYPYRDATDGRRYLLG